jgi:hypothetical protein
MVSGRAHRSELSVVRKERIVATRWGALLPTVAASLAVSGGVLLATLVIHWRRGVALGDLTRDPAAISGVPVYTGFLSNMGMLFWSSTVAVCFFTATFVARRAATRPTGRFLYASGLLTLLLLMDDLFQLHERVFPLSLGIPEPIVFLGYGSMTLVYLTRFRRVILDSEYLLLGLALGCFGLSVAVDVLTDRELYLWEDGAKFVGIVTWLAYFARVSAQVLRRPRLVGARRPRIR